jgi:hypothetical protein
MPHRATWVGLLVVVVHLIGAGCAAEPRYKNVATTLPTTLPEPTGLLAPAYMDAVGATVTPPVGWRQDPLKSSSRHTHQVWVSPSGRTAYGVIHFSLPLPVGYDPVLWYFMREMRRVEGEGVLLSKQWDPNLRGLRFVAQGKLYTVRPSLLLRGFKGWAIYAGTLNNQPTEPAELDLAERARERTITGRVAAKAVAAGDHPGR